MGTSRQALLQWVNGVLDASYTRLEDLSDAVAYCQLMDILYPRCGVLTKVKIPAKNMFEYKNNYKCLQASFNKMKVGKVVPIDRLMRAKFQDNYEFLQWFKKLYDCKVKSNNEEELPASMPRRDSLPVTSRYSSAFVGAANSPRSSPRPTSTPRTYNNPQIRSMSAARAASNRGSPRPTTFKPGIRSFSLGGSPGMESMSGNGYFRPESVRNKSSSICDLEMMELLTPKKSKLCTSIRGHSGFASNLPRIAPITKEHMPVQPRKRTNSLCSSPIAPTDSGIDSESTPRTSRRCKSLASRRRSRSFCCMRNEGLTPNKAGPSSNTSRATKIMRSNSFSLSKDSSPKTTPQIFLSDTDSSIDFEDLPMTPISSDPKDQETISDHSVNGDTSVVSNNVLHLDEVVKAASTLMTWRQAERNFYYNKLRRIEILCQCLDQDSPFAQQVFKIMYATHDMTTTAKFS